jgi:hypothetical protein
MAPMPPWYYSLTKFRSKDEDSKHKMWFIFDNDIILPEYLVEFDYELTCN